MAIARLPVIFILALDLLQIFVQGQILCSCPSGIPKTSLANLIASDPRIGELISKAKSQKLRTSQDCKCGNNEVTIGIQSNKQQRNGIGLEDYLNLRQQQQMLTSPLNSQPLSVDICPPLSYQNFEQSQLLNRQQFLGLHQAANEKFQENLISRSTANNQQNQQSLNIQPPTQTLNSVQWNPFAIENSQVLGQQRNALSEIPLASLQVGNQLTQDLLTQDFQGRHLSSLGQPSSIPVTGPNSCQNPVTNQVPVSGLQNNAAAFCNGLSQLSTQVPTEYSTNNQPPSNSLFIPWSSPAVRVNLNSASKELNHNANSNKVIEVQQPLQHQPPIQMQQSTQTQQPRQTQEFHGLQQGTQTQQPHHPQQVIQTQQINQLQSPIQNQQPIQMQGQVQIQQPNPTQQPIKTQQPIQQHHQVQAQQTVQSQPPYQTQQLNQAQLPTQIEQPIYMQQSIQAQQQIQTQQPIQKQESIQTQQPVQAQQPILIQQPTQLQSLGQSYPVQPQSSQVINTPSEPTEVEFIPQTPTTAKSATPEHSSSGQPAVTQQVSVPSPSNQPAVTFDQCKPVRQNQPSAFDANLLSQLESSGPSPQYPSSSQIYTTKSSSKSGSTMKALLPLIFNLLKERNYGCGGCPSNCNCGCMNNYGYMQDNQQMNPFNHYYNNKNWNNNWPTQESCTEQDEEEYEDEGEEEEDYGDSTINVQNNSPQVSDSYASQIKYGLPKEKDISENCIESEETTSSKSKVSPKKVQEKKKYAAKDYQNKKKFKDNSKDDNENDYESYENED